MTKRLICLLIAALAFTSAAQALNTDIVPLPQNLTLEKGVFTLRSGDSITCPEEFKTQAEIFTKQVESIIKLTEASAKSRISISKNAALSKEAYTLKVSKSGISIEAADRNGVLYGLQTLRQLIVNNPKGIPCLSISDKPQFPHRGALLDVSRHPFSIDEIKAFIDMLLMHKMNKLHWHLTDDQGWRIEIKKYPLLSTISSSRPYTIAQRKKVDGKYVYDGKEVRMIYTQDQIRDIVRYALERGVDIIPEIEMPGHAIAALTAYPELGCTGKDYHVWCRWGISDDVYCAGKEKTFEFLQDVLTEVISLFPNKYLHFGGDECPKVRWKVCPDCQKRMRDLGLKNEEELQGWFMNRMSKWLSEHNRIAIGWDEIMAGKNLSKDVVVMSWRGQSPGLRAAEAGHDVIATPREYCYVDYCQTSDIEKYETLEMQHAYLPLRQCYRLDPLNRLRIQHHKHILGVQANLWTEYIATFARATWQFLPRAAAIAEAGWNQEGKSNYNEFMKRLFSLRKLYDLEKYNYATYAFEGIE